MNPSHRFDLHSTWHLAAPPERVWQALTDTAAWPRWWSYVRAVQTLRPGDADGLGALRRITWGTRLPYELVIDVEAVESRRHERLRGISHGHLRGEGLWELRPTAQGTELRYTWRVDVTQPWMRRLAPLLAPLFRWNHRRVMRAGEAGLARWLSAGPDASA
jgi:uncharacterized protein YndB with AHSA1/START domain